jgi:hypothetical protein
MHAEVPEEVLTWARVMRNPLRQHVLVEYAQRIASPSDVAVSLGARLNLVSYHTQVLLRAGCIELVRTERRRGASKHYYRAQLRSEIGDASWEQVPTRLRRALVRGTIDDSFREAGDALPRGGMDAATSHISRSFFELDAQARVELAGVLADALSAARRIERASRERAPAERRPYELVIMCFEAASGP